MVPDTCTVQERLDVSKLVKGLAVKCAQIVVQSRDGTKTQTKCNPNGSDNLFNLTINEQSDVEKEAKRVMKGAEAALDRCWPLCVDIYLKTVDGDVMTLETWSINLIENETEKETSPKMRRAQDHPKLSSQFTVYSRLGIMLKSLLSITRVIPAYRYSRRQNSDSYLIGHKIYVGDVKLEPLGEKCKQLKIGNANIPAGFLQLSVAYRTIMTISPQPSGIQTSIMVKSDHFQPDYSPKGNRNNSSSETIGSFREESAFKIGAFVESRRDSAVPSESEFLIPSVPFASLIGTPRVTGGSLQQSPPDYPPRSVNAGELCNRLAEVALQEENEQSFDKDQQPLLNKESEALLIKNQPGSLPKEQQESFPRKMRTRSASSYNEDFVLLDPVKPAFAESTGNIELGLFYQEWQSAPPLQACDSTNPRVIDQLGDLTEQLESYENCSKEFDTMVTSLCQQMDTEKESIA